MFVVMGFVLAMAVMGARGEDRPNERWIILGISAFCASLLYWVRFG